MVFLIVLEQLEMEPVTHQRNAMIGRALLQGIVLQGNLNINPKSHYINIWEGISMSRISATMSTVQE
jgi:hypothetical protein